MSFRVNQTNNAATSNVSFQAPATNSGPTVKLGSFAGYNNQGTSGVAIGSLAGYASQGNNSIAVGSSAGYVSQGANSIAIGNLAAPTQQYSNSIVLNASGTVVSSLTANSLSVSPMRTLNALAGTARIIYYDTTTKEVFAYIAP